MSIRTFIILAGVSIAMRIQARESDANTYPNSHATQTTAITPVTIEADGQKAVLSNGLVTVEFDLATGTYSVNDLATGETVLADAGVCNTWEDDFKLSVESQSDVSDTFGKGKQIRLRVTDPWYGSWDPAPAPLFSYTVYEGSSAVVMGFGLATPEYCSIKLREAFPLARGKLFPGKTFSNPLTLNGSAGSETAEVKPGLARRSPNSLMITGLVEGKRRTVVWGGLGYADFGKYAAIRDGILELKAEDPVGRLVPTKEIYFPKDTFYLDVATTDPFVALEKYGRAMRLANNAKPNVYDFPVLCGWGVGALSGLGNINNSAKLVGELDLANRCGLTRYTKVGIRLEPDKYHGDSEQGWWDDAHWAKFGHLVAPYDTMAKWCAAISSRNGIPYTYFQVGMPSDDYARAFPGHMLFNDISQIERKHSHHQPQVSFDYTDPGFQKHMRVVWSRLRKDGMRGIKFDYPETGWRPEGGFDDRYATAASAYRKAFELAREGLGPDAFLDERNMGESNRPRLDVAAGIVDTQRNWGDSNAFVPGMVSVGGLRWYKNRTVFNYYPDSKCVHGCTPEIRKSMLTMVYLTSGRIDLATSFSLFTPEITHDFSRIYPAYHEPFTARPLDAFTGIKDPQVYDLELSQDWHQIALFNSGKKPAAISTAISGDRTTNAVGLDPKSEYYAYEFWTDTFLGKLPSTGRVEQTLDPRHCAMISLRKVQPNPQILSTNRHVLQGWVELSDTKWNSAARHLTGTAKVIGGEAFKMVVAGNGSKPVEVTAKDATARIEPHTVPGLYVITLEQPSNGDTLWQVEFESAK